MSAPAFPISPKQKIDFKKIEMEGWEFYSSNLPMFNTKELDQISDVITTQTLPDIVFGYNRLFFVNKKRNFLYEFSPIDSLSLSSFALQDIRLHPDSKEESKDAPMEEIKEEEPSSHSDIDEITKLNRIDMKPERVEVKMAEKWKTKDTSGIEDFKEIEVISDWTYSTPYKGTILYLDKNIERIKDDFGLEIEMDEAPEHSDIRVERCDDEIPVDRLTPANPIIHYMEVELFEDELDDNGHTSSKVRFRIMKD
jgi:hypothetical protein